MDVSHAMKCGFSALVFSVDYNNKLMLIVLKVSVEDWYGSQFCLLDDLSLLYDDTLANDFKHD